MLVLGLDTSTTVCSVALMDHHRLVAEYTLNAGYVHSERLMPLIDRLLSDAGFQKRDIDLFAVSQGPGSFTGLRIGVVTAKALAYSLNKPVVGVPTLDALAFNVIGFGALVCTMLDARKDEVYTALYRKDGDGLKRLTEYETTSPRELLSRLGLERYKEPVVFLGDAVERHAGLLAQSLGARFKSAPRALMWPRAGSVAELGLNRALEGQLEDVFSLKPIYLRSSEAEVRWQRHRKAEGEPGGRAGDN